MFNEHVCINSAISPCPPPLPCAECRVRVRTAGDTTRHDAAL